MIQESNTYIPLPAFIRNRPVTYLTFALLIFFLISTLQGCSDPAKSSGVSAEKTANSGEAEKVIVVTAEDRKIAGIETSPVQLRTLSSELEVNGRILPDVNKEIEVRPRFSGRITSIVARLGTAVKKGDRLAVIDSAEISELQGEYIESLAKLDISLVHEKRESDVLAENLRRPEALTDARARRDELEIQVTHAQANVDRLDYLNKEKIASMKDVLAARAMLERHKVALKEAETDFQREQRLFENKGLLKRDYEIARAESARERHHAEIVKQRLLFCGMTPSMIEEIKKTGKLMPLLPVNAPADGIVSTQDVSVGEIVSPGKRLFTIRDLSTVIVAADVPEVDISKINNGMEISVEVASFPDTRFHGTVDYIGDQVSTTTRVVPIRAVLDNSAGQFKANMFVQVLLPTEPKEVLACPVDAVHERKGVKVVYVSDGDRFIEKKVITGKEMGPYVEILEGIKPGNEVVTAGSLLLKSESAHGKQE